MHNTAGEPFNNIETVYGGDGHMPHVRSQNILEKTKTQGIAPDRA